jgi:hypothetical protein
MVEDKKKVIEIKKMFGVPPGTSTLPCILHNTLDPWIWSYNDSKSSSFSNK